MPEVVVKMHVRTPVATLQTGITAVDGMSKTLKSIGCIVVLGAVRINEGNPREGNLGGGERGTRSVVGVRRGFAGKEEWMSYSAMLAIATRESEGTIRAPSAVSEKIAAAEGSVRPSKDMFSFSSS